MKNPKHKSLKHSDNNKTRRPYEKPAVVHREMMEAIAGLCDATGDPVNAKTGVGDGCTNTYS